MNDRSKEQSVATGSPETTLSATPAPVAVSVDAPVAILSVGDRLRAAREARKMSLEDVSQAIKIAPRVLEQVEGNAWAQLPGYTFARGVVRSYARLLKLDPEALLRDLESAPMPKLPLLELRPSTQAALPVPGEANKRDRYAMLAGVLLVALAVVAYFLIPDDWLGEHSMVKTKVPMSGEASPAPTAAPVAAAPVSAIPATPMLQTQGGTAEAPMVPPPGAAPTVAQSSPAGTPAALSGPSSVASTGPAAPNASLTQSPNPAASDPPTLVLRFEEGSWAEIRDKTGAMLISENVSPRSERQLGGVPPYNIWLGNADGVRISYRGQPVDLKPHTRQKVARLVLE
jgi:cytoskeleton protein RodZ